MNKKNVWKIMFIALLAINVLILVSSGLLLFLAGGDQPEIELTDSPKKNMSEFLIKTDKNDLNQLINHYIEKEKLNGPIHYSVLLSDEVVLFGEIEVFSQTLQLIMTFDSEALDNGDLLLKQNSLSLGGVKLPVSYILKFIKDAYKLPEWVIIQPNDKQIYVALQNMRLNNGIQIRAQKFDIAKNEIELKMLVPVE